MLGKQTLYKTGKVIAQLFVGRERASHCEDAHRTIDTPGYRVNAFRGRFLDNYWDAASCGRKVIVRG